MQAEKNQERKGGRGEQDKEQEMLEIRQEEGEVRGKILGEKDGV